MSEINISTSARKLEKLEDYKKFYHAKKYIHQLSSQIKDSRKPTPELIDLMKGSGYSKFEKFRKHRELWDAFWQDIYATQRHFRLFLGLNFQSNLGILVLKRYALPSSWY